MNHDPDYAAVHTAHAGTFVHRYLLRACGGDWATAGFIGQLIYWHGTDPNGKRRAGLERDGHWWVAKTYGEWQNELEATEERVRRVMAKAVELGLVCVDHFRFGGNRTGHFRPNYAALRTAMEAFGEDVDVGSGRGQKPRRASGQNPRTEPGQKPPTEGGQNPRVGPGQKPPGLNKTSTKTSSEITAADAAEDAGEAARSAAAAGHTNAGLAVVLVDAEPEPLTLAGAVALVAFGHADATVPTKHLVEYDKAVRLLGQGGYSADDVLDADDHWRRAYERRHDRQPTSARVTQVVQHCAEWRLATQPEGPLFDRAAYGRPDDDGAPLPAWPPPADPAPLPPTTAQDLWQRTLTALQLQMTRATFDAWLKRTRAIELDGDTLVVEVPNAATRDWLTSRLANAMRDAVATVAGPDVAWRFVVAEREAVVA